MFSATTTITRASKGLDDTSQDNEQGKESILTGAGDLKDASVLGLALFEIVYHVVSRGSVL